jgi:hypothetical protein
MFKPGFSLVLCSVTKATDVKVNLSLHLTFMLWTPMIVMAEVGIISVQYSLIHAFVFQIVSGQGCGC